MHKRYRKLAGLVALGQPLVPPRYLTDPDFHGVITGVDARLTVGDPVIWDGMPFRVCWTDDPEDPAESQQGTRE